ncbi:MAG TPA: hypothetical protein VIE64_00620 [Solirubrobacterales bacterium]|jgi:hypothetical protein
MNFATSISVLGLLQAALVALPRSPLPTLPEPLRLNSRWWALVPALSIVVVIAAIELDSDSATALSYLALVAVPGLAAVALGCLVQGAQPIWAVAAVPLFGLAWALQGALAGEVAAATLSALACIGLGWLLVSVAPAVWLRIGIYAMAAIDAWLVGAQLLQEPSSVLSAADPAGLPRLQVVEFGSARMGFGDIFVAALAGCLLAASPRLQLRAAILVAILALVFDLLFFEVDTLPATVPVALALALVSWRRSAGVADQGDRIDGAKPSHG